MRKPVMMIAAAGVLWGLLSLFFRFFTELGMDAIQAVCIRNSAAAVLMAAVLAVKSPGSLRLKRPAHILYFVGTGMVSLAFFNVCYFLCIELAGVVLSAPLFGERMSGRKLGALALTVLGCGCVTGALGGGVSVSWKAVAIGLGSGLGYALYTIFGKFALRDYESVTITAYTVLFAALGTLPLSRPAEMLTMIDSPKAALLCVASGLFCTVAPYLLYTKGLEGVESGQAAILATVEPVVAAMVGIFVFRETATIGKLTGIALILISILMMSKTDKTTQNT